MVWLQLQISVVIVGFFWFRLSDLFGRIGLGCLGLFGRGGVFFGGGKGGGRCRGFHLVGIVHQFQELRADHLRHFGGVQRAGFRIIVDVDRARPSRCSAGR
jgi:hypothetical protein